MKTLRTTSPRLGLAAVVLALASVSAPAQDAGPADALGRLDDTRSALEQWVSTRRLIAKEKRDWAIGKEVLQDRIDIVQSEIATTREAIAAKAKEVEEADAKVAEMTARRDELERGFTQLEAVIGDLEGRTRALLGRLPEPARDRVKLLSQRLPEDGATTRQRLTERFMNVAGILTILDKLQREITLTSERRDLPDGTTAEVTVLYLGVSQGYYVTEDGSAAGVGTSTTDGWSWTPADEAAPQIAQAIAIMESEEPAAFVHLPLRLDG